MLHENYDKFVKKNINLKRELPNIKLVDNDEIEVFGYKYYDNAFLERLSNYFSEKKEEILNFFELESYQKIRINLFDNLETLNNFSSKFISLSPYHKGDCCGDMINYFCDDMLLNDYSKTGYLIASLSHEFVHMVYHDTIRGNTCVWLEEGLATYLSGQKRFFELTQENYIGFLKKYIVNSELPKIEFLHNRGGKYGQFVDMETHKYDGYYISYGIVRYLYEEKGYQFLLKIIKEKEKLEELEKTLMEDYLKYCKYLIANFEKRNRI